MQLKTVKIDKPDDTNFVLGQTHFIKSVEDIQAKTPVVMLWLLLR
jgi:adenosine/AMP kinase